MHVCFIRCALLPTIASSLHGTRQEWYTKCLGKESDARENLSYLYLSIALFPPLSECTYHRMHVCMSVSLKSESACSTQLVVCVLAQTFFTSSFSSVLLLWLGDIISSSLSHVLLQYTTLCVWMLLLLFFNFSVIHSSCYFPQFCAFWFLLLYSTLLIYPSDVYVEGSLAVAYLFVHILHFRTLVVQLNYACVQSTIVPLTRSGKHTICGSIHVHSSGVVACYRHVHNEQKWRSLKW